MAYEPTNFNGVAHVGYIAYSWLGADTFVTGNNADPTTVVTVVEGGDDLVFDGGDPTSTYYERADGQPVDATEFYEIEVASDAAFTNLLASATQKDTTYRISVPDANLAITHYARVRASVFGMRTDWVSASPVLPFRFQGGSKVSGGAFRIGSSDVSPNSLDQSALADTIEVGEQGFSTLVARSDRTLTFTHDGIRLIDGGSTVVELPTSASTNASFVGDVIASSLTSVGTTLQNTTTATIGSSITLASGKYPNPVIGPNASNQYPWYRGLPTSGGWGLFLDVDGGGGGSRTIWMTNFPSAIDTASEYLIGSGMGNPSFIRSITITGAEIHAVCRVNGLIVVLYALSGAYYIQSYDRTTLAKVGGANTVSSNCYQPTLIADLTNTSSANLFFLIDTSTSSGTPTAFRWRHYETNQSTGALTLRATVTNTGTLPQTLANVSFTSLCGTTSVNPTSTTTTAYLSVPDTLAERVYKFTITRNSTTKYATGIAYTSGNDSAFESPWGGAPWGWSYDSSTQQFAVISGNDDLLWESSSSATDVSAYTITYAWLYEGPPKYTTTTATSTSLTRIPFTAVYVDVPNPTITTGYTYIPDQGYVYANGKLQTTVTLNTVGAGGTTTNSYVTAYWTTYNSSGAASPTSSTFPTVGGTSAVLQSESAGWAFYGDGTYTGITGTPTGALLPYAGPTAPTGYLLCQGQAVSRTTYSALWDVLRAGTSSSPYGNGDGSTTFNVPNLQQRFPLGKAASGTGNALGGTGGAIDHSHSASVSGSTSLDSHSHSGAISGSTGVPQAGNGLTTGTSTVAGGQHTHSSTPQTISVGSDSHSHTVSASGTSGTNNPPYLVVNFIIKT